MDYASYREGTGGQTGSSRPLGVDGRSSVSVGLFLVLVGCLFLVLRTAPGASWWTLWPALIVIGGLVQVLTPGPVRGWGIERVSEGAGTMFLGLLLLGNTTGSIGWEMWLIALAYWPVLLISAGIGLIGHASRQAWIRAGAPVIVWVTLAYCASAAWTGSAIPSEVFSVLGIG